ncbi:MAG TPA: Hsp20 family protein [Burkholderiaceae bacterium]|nr:Hsp20 family protein [Burkholderiaceae bacterium]
MARIEQSVEVNVPVHTAYNQWTQFEEFPRFMQWVREVRQLDDAHLHWRVDRNGEEVEWDSEITDQVPDQHIAWRDISGPMNSGSITFYPMQPDKTRVQMTMECEPATAPSEAAQGEQVIAQRVEQDLARFKKLIEGQGGESGAWRGEIHYSQPVQSSSGTATGDATNSPAGKTVGQAARERQDAAQSAPPAFSTEQASNRQSSSGSVAADSGSDAMTAGQQTRGDADPRAAQQPQARSGTGSDSQEPETPAKASGPQAWFPNLLHGWEEPREMIRKMSEEMDQLFERFIGRPMVARFGQGGATGKWMPPVEISQRDNRLIISADLPGIAREDVQVEIDNGKLTIEGERREETQQTAVQGYRRSERSYGRFYRMIPLPDGIDPDMAQASMQDGVLEITFPVSTSISRRGRRIDIQRAH